MGRFDQRGENIDQEVLRAIREIRYGSVEVIIHDSKIVQIARTEKVRLDTSGAGKR